MKRLVTLLLSLLLVYACATRPENYLRKTKKKIEPSESITYTPKTISFTDSVAVGAHMNFLASDALKGRDTGTEGLEMAAAYIQEEFQKYGLSPYFESFRDTLSNFKKPTYNVVGFLEGSDPQLKSEFIIIGAHYDHIGFADRVNGDAIANGANDNASGTTAVLELARYFGKNKQHKRSLLFALFSAEERGLLGSKHLAERLKADSLNLYSMVNFEMIGVPMRREFPMYITGYKRSNMAERMNVYAGKEIIGYLPTAAMNNLFQRSDNYPFHKSFKVPSQTVCTFDFDNYQYYHHVDDEADKMDYPHMSRVINDMIIILDRMASTTEKEIIYNK